MTIRHYRTSGITLEVFKEKVADAMRTGDTLTITANEVGNELARRQEGGAERTFELSILFADQVDGLSVQAQDNLTHEWVDVAYDEESVIIQVVS